MEGVERAFLIVIAFVCIVSSAIFVMHGVAITRTHTLAAASVAPVATTLTPPVPTRRQEATDCPKGAACLESKPKEIKPLADCVNISIHDSKTMHACSKQKEIAEKQISRCTQGTKKGDVCEPYEMIKVVYTSNGCFYKAGEKIVGKCNPNPTKECPTVSSTIGALCTWDSKDPECECGKTSDEKTSEQKQDGDKKGVSSDDIADADQPQQNMQQNNSANQGADAAFGDGQQQGGGSGGGGSPSGGGGGSDSGSPPLPEQRSDALIARDREISESLQNTQNEIDSVEERLDAYYDREGARGTDEESTLLRERENLSRTREELLAERAELAPYVRSEASERIQEIGSPQTMSEYAEQQNLRRQVSELDQLVSQGEGYGRQPTVSRPQLGGPYVNPNLQNDTMYYDTPRPDPRVATLYANDGSAQGGGSQSSFRGPDGTNNINGHTLEDYLACTASGGSGCYAVSAGPLGCAGCVRTTLEDFHFRGSDGAWRTLPSGSTLVQYDSGALATGLDLVPYQGARDSALGGTYGTGALTASGPQYRGGVLQTQIIGIYTPTHQQGLRRLSQLRR